MKTLILAAALLIPVLNSNAQVSVVPGLVFDTTVYQLGLVNKGSVAEHVFTFVNKSKISVVISNVRIYCSCIVCTWTKEPVKPNASGEIKIRYFGKSPGTFSKTVKVFTNISNEPVNLTVRGQCK